MRRIILTSAVTLLTFAATSVGEEAAAPKHVIVKATDLKWGDPPPVFARGASFTVISGDPMAAGPYVVRLKMPADYKIMPHWHPTDEHVTVISGTFLVGMGDTFDRDAMTELQPGGYTLLPAQMRHYAMAKTAGIVQVHGMGPFKLNYVNADDDPSRQDLAK